jgi:hypothetical protein
LETYGETVTSEKSNHSDCEARERIPGLSLSTLGRPFGNHPEMKGGSVDQQRNLVFYICVNHLPSLLDVPYRIHALWTVLEFDRRYVDWE